MKPCVCVHRTGSYGYSDIWKDRDDYPEITYLRGMTTIAAKDGANIFSDLAKPGDTVVIKPNWVYDEHPSGYTVFSIITHSSIIKATAELLYEAMKGTGRIIIADAPQSDCDFDNLMTVTEVEAIVDYFWRKHRFPIDVYDLRQMAMAKRPNGGFLKAAHRRALPGDPKGYTAVDLGVDSAFVGLSNSSRIYGADYDRATTSFHHSLGKHEYLVSNTILCADVLVSIPKLKVHKKVGSTLNAKGMVGTIGNKNWIPHYRVGPPAAGGDEFPDTEQCMGVKKSSLIRKLKDMLLSSNSKCREMLFDSIHQAYELAKPILGGFSSAGTSVADGNWFGNDTAWRMTADLATLIVHSDKNGVLHSTQQRRFFSIVDGIIGGEAEGPLDPRPVHAGVLIAGDNLLVTDMVATRLMGLDWKKVKYLTWLAERELCPQQVSDVEER